ncbi:DUF3040 domain-containing protein [Amycolatopsis nigrescens]|uniref:DUF3040 domain-containing protein n=1 Tax=Amycolatopsis nigrescens TaxID=381445 RepID=UPI00058D1FB0|nr:DUF3040 domain-containing protein [Amycolatopsis nigrescens]
MTLHDEEQRRLAEIERRLAEDDPRLADRLAELRPMRLPAAVVGVLGILTTIAAGLVVMVLGAQQSSPVLIVIGTLLVAGVPTLIVWRLWLHRIR